MKTQQPKCDSSVPTTAPAAATEEEDLGSETQMPMGVASEETGFAPWIPPFKYSHTRIVDSKDHLILDMRRGWGFLTGLGGLKTGASLGIDPDEASKIQDRVGRNIAAAMNERAALISSGSTTKSVVSGEKENQPAPRPMDQQRTETGLLPCPFCGSDVEQWKDTDDRWFTECKKCDIWLPTCDWNRRASPAPATATEEKKIRSLANLLVCTSTELAFTQLPSYEAKVEKFEQIIREFLPQPSVTDEQAEKEGLG